ncbi:MAG TPA: UDP-N-acetylmuramoyl-tripeptide--D-alanyl-D-alanine ligase [Candidatus Baltobacteraceae bacterium]|jgi:UDP-N-acetylmuramoyl-tripeptide--D-alanyl-D-alanine ligase|nr:UDP-N-acetylmuramoyl-tripeptide--D-alanyl-D-alanine ligase [Candidatus Baltobacteraceae bacterium]
MKIPIQKAVTLLGATLFDADGAPDEVRVCTDTRALERGDTFLALTGERFNGHDYTAEAVKRGASMLIVDEPGARVPGVATLLVDRTLSAYMTLAGVARDVFAGRVIAVTGSTGKTTTKAFLTQLLAAKYGDRVIAAPANENNEIGVSKLLLAASNEEHDVIVIEMGARKFGDIATLVAFAKPEVGVLTNVGEAHLEIMGSRERLADTKWALFERGARAVLNADDAVSVKRADRLAQPPHWFAAREAEGAEKRGRLTTLVGRSCAIDRDGDRFEEIDVDVNVPGVHNRANAAAAIAGALELGVPLESMRGALATLRLPDGRFESFRTSAGWRVIYDAYNANASGMVAALDAFAMEKPERAIAVLGSMAELGDESVKLHERVGAHAAKRVDVLLVGGEYADALARGAAGAGFSSQMIVTIEDNAHAARWLREHARRGDVVLLKGSRKYKLEEIVEDLLQ